ncbi:hypothetical protein AGR7C_Lc140210 [Agrobacterium deltaense Zutra 3/1]|uniref:Uncharacterized protein n=1 Tax=Agrobacterium deltaense Zutra 3/1 TaxID=1183427 RepID=A0A1S7RC17_9HYPH|nr:hypothetical protein AGR7C_Lc140210 [Agrobacterium deltaense Zutra 3/1]
MNRRPVFRWASPGDLLAGAITHLGRQREAKLSSDAGFDPAHTQFSVRLRKFAGARP